MTFSHGERALSEWMEANALVCWTATPEPSFVEASVIADLATPLNLDQNAAGPFCRTLREARPAARQRARSLPAVGPKRT